MGDSNIFERMVGKFQSMMHYTAFKVVKDKQIAEDVVQEVWIKVINQGKNLPQIEKLGAWLKTITVRTAIDQLRKEKRSHMNLFQEANWMEELNVCAGNSVEDSLNCSFMLEELEQCISSHQTLLPVFQLKFKLELDDQQIADILNISYAAVKTRVFRTRQLLKKSYLAA